MSITPTAWPRDSSALRAVLGRGPVVREFRGRGDVETLSAQEFTIMERATAARRREFAAGRSCARSALTALGFEEASLLPGPGRDPQWPHGVVGSITHCRGFAAAAVARTESTRAVGIDAEPAEPLPPEVVEAALDEAERVRWAQLAEHMPHVPWDRVVFCAKESIFKSWFPLCRQWLGFKEASVHVEADGTFSAAILRDAENLYPHRVAGRWTIDKGILVAGLLVDVL